MIVLTAYADPDIVKACHDAGVGSLLEKPFRLQELREAVRNAVAATEPNPTEPGLGVQGVEVSRLEHSSKDGPLGTGAA